MSSWPLPIELTELILSRVCDVSNLRSLRDRGKRFLCSPDERESLKAASLVCREWHDIVSPVIFEHSLVKLLHAQAFRDFLMMPSRVHASVSNLICLEPCSCERNEITEDDFVDVLNVCSNLVRVEYVNDNGPCQLGERGVANRRADQGRSAKMPSLVCLEYLSVDLAHGLDYKWLPPLLASASSLSHLNVWIATSSSATTSRLSPAHAPALRYLSFGGKTWQHSTGRHALLNILSKDALAHVTHLDLSDPDNLLQEHDITESLTGVIDLRIRDYFMDEMGNLRFGRLNAVQTVRTLYIGDFQVMDTLTFAELLTAVPSFVEDLTIACLYTNVLAIELPRPGELLLGKKLRRLALECLDYTNDETVPEIKRHLEPIIDTLLKFGVTLVLC